MRRRVLVALVALGAVAAVGVPARAHTASNFFNTAKWVTDKSVNYSFTPSGAPTPEWRARNIEAANTWNALGQSMTFTPAPDMGDFDPYVCPTVDQKNGIHRRRIDGSGGTLARTMTCWYSNKALSTFQLVYDDGDSWYLGTGTPARGQADLLSVAVHELGHATGFSKHLSAGSAICAVESTQHTMCPSHLFGSTWQRSLEKHDIHTFGAAY